MRAPALLVSRTEGETTRRALVSIGALRTDLAIEQEGDRLAFPVLAEIAIPASWGTVEEREFVVRSRPGPSDYRDLLDWPSAEKATLPRAFDVIGDIVLVRLPPSLAPRRFDVGEALLRFVPGARVVGEDRGVHGEERRRSVERIAGTGGWTTRHRENLLAFDVDVEQAYFSPRLAREHGLVAAEVSEGESVYDLCCGVGPFSVTIAREGRARSITAVDTNPTAIALLRRTLARYGFGDRVRPVEGRVETFAVENPPGDRVLLNLPREGIKYATLVARLVSPGGHFRYYEVVPRDQVDERGTMIENLLAPRAPFVVRSQRVVHPYSPGADLVSFLLERAER